LSLYPRRRDCTYGNASVIVSDEEHLVKRVMQLTAGQGVYLG
jgi:hypothetical protein